MAKIIVSVLILGGAAFFIFSGNGKDKETVANNESVEEGMVEVGENKVKDIPEEDFEQKTTLSELMKKNGDYMCTFVHNTQIGESTGTVYMSDKKIRGDFVSKVSMSGLPNMDDIKSYMISDGESVYTWSSMTSEGYKVPVSEQGGTASTDSNVPTDQELDYKCTGWKVDESKFQLPTNITFKSF